MLEEFRSFLCDQLIRARFTEGPKVSSMESGSSVSYTKKDLIVSIQIGRGDDQGNCLMYMECERKVPELDEIWDQAIINYGKELMKRLRKFSINKSRVVQGITQEKK
jgi:hypothetical protein